MPRGRAKPARRVLVLDIGGTHVKALATGRRRPRRFRSGPELTAEEMVRGVRRLVRGWSYDVVSIGFPGPARWNRPLHEPPNLGPGWVGFDFAKAFGRPVRLVNDAAMQALGSYDGGKMLFLGLGTGLGSALIDSGRVEPMELAHLPYRKGRTYEDYVGEQGLRRLGLRRWRRRVRDVIARLQTALEPDYTVLGGGNAAKVRPLPPKVRLGTNFNAFVGGFRLWEGTGEPPLVRAPVRRRPRHA